MSDNSDQLIRRAHRRYFRRCFNQGTRPMSYKKFKDDIDRSIKRYIATDLARAVAEQQPEKDMYIATPALDVKEEIIEKFGFKFKDCSKCKAAVAIDPKMLEMAEQAESIICVDCLPDEVEVTMDEITKIVLGEKGIRDE
jgi:hypothetical protein